METRYRIYAFACAALCAGVALFGFREMFVYLAGAFSDPYEDMSYAWFVPPFSLYLLWRKRAAIRQAAREGAPSLSGVVLLLPCLFLEWIGRRDQWLDKSDYDKMVREWTALKQQFGL